jgi:hypothetical protein
MTSWNLGDAFAKQGDLAREAELMQVHVDYLCELGPPEVEKRTANLEQLQVRGCSNQIEIQSILKGLTIPETDPMA